MDPDAISALIQVDSWPAALVIVVFVLAVLVWPGVMGWLNSRRTQQTLTKNNGGGSVKDALDLVQATQAEHGQMPTSIGRRVTALEETATEPEPRRDSSE